MNFTEPKIREMRYFFGAVGSLSEHPKDRFNKKIASGILEKLVEHLRNFDISDNMDLTKDQKQLFSFLEGVAHRQQRYEKMLVVVMIAIMISFIVCFFVVGWLEAIILLGALLLVAFSWAAIMWRYYITRKFSPLSVGLTPAEVQFAINFIIKGSGWS